MSALQSTARSPFPPLFPLSFDAASRWVPALVLRGVALLAVLVLAAAPAFGAQIVVINLDAGTGLGYDDPTLVAPEGGNPGITLGEQRLIAAQFGADLWGSVLDSPVPILLVATFRPLPCTPTAAVAGSTGAAQVFADFPPGPPAVAPDTWYHSALADAIAGFDLGPGAPDIVSQFNLSIQGDPNCLGGRRFYYGLDNQEGDNVDFLSVFLHELAHGLGFGNFVDESTGANFLGLTDIYSIYTLDTVLGLSWSEMDDAERAASAVRSGAAVWSGPEVSGRVSRFLDHRAVLQAVDPPLGLLSVQPAAFGPPLTLQGVTGTLVLADDGVGIGSDACEPIVNRVRHAIALIDRGTCTFTTKVHHAEEAGAIAVVVANNEPGGPASMGGVDTEIGIPSAGVDLFQGQFLRTVPDLEVRLGLSADLFLGTDGGGNVLLYAPAPAIPGSSISHWDRVATPNLLMEPAVASDLETLRTLDLTPYLLRDVGWRLTDGDADGVADVEDACAVSDTSPTVVLGDCDSGVANTGLGDGCTLADRIADCASAGCPHGSFVSCVAYLAGQLRRAGILSGAEKGALVSCAARNGR